MGRPRSEATRLAALTAVAKLLERQSVRDLTIEAVAEEAGIGKATIYRWWSSRSALVIDAFIEIIAPDVSKPRPGTTVADLMMHFGKVAKGYHKKHGKLISEIVAEGQFDRDAFEYFLSKVILRRRDFARDIVSREQAAGNIRDDVSADTLIDMLYGPLYFRLLIGHRPIDDEFAADITSAINKFISRK